MKLELHGGPRSGGWRGHGEYELGVDPPLLTCPFCGGEEITVENTHTPYYMARCDTCDAEGPGSDFHGNCPGDKWRPGLSKAKTAEIHRAAFLVAIEAWNERVHAVGDRGYPCVG